MYAKSDEEDKDDNIPLSVLALNLKRVWINMNEKDIEDYIAADDNMPTMMTISDEDIVKSVMPEQEAEQEEEEKEEEEDIVKPVSSAKPWRFSKP